MRRVSHSSVPTPMILASDEAVQARSEIAEFLGRSDDERSTRRASINERLYRSKEVQEALFGLFKGKCAYCEDNRERLDVEHHRPRANASGARKSFPDHYSWLAYEWENLLLVCAACSRRKAARFPLRGGRAALLAEIDQVRAQESPELLDPGYDRPERHLDFTLDGECHARTKRGAATIKILELNRPPLLEGRRAVFQEFAARVRGAGTPDGILDLMAGIENDDPHAGAMLILRYHYAEALANSLDHFRFPFDDTRGVLPRLHASTQMRTLLDAFARLERPRTEAQPSAPSTTAEIQAWQGFSPAIRRVEIHNFKAIKQLEIDFPEKRVESGNAACIMILGENATGKSSILEAMTLALSGTDLTNQLKLRPRDYVRIPASGETASIAPARVTVEFYEGARAELTIAPHGTRFEGTAAPMANIQAYGSRRFFLKGRRRRARSGGIRGMFDPLWVLPHPDLWLRTLNEDQFRQVVRSLRDVLSLTDDRDFLRDPDDGVVITSKDSSEQISIERHSEGYRSLFATAVDIMRGMMGTAPDLSEARGVVLIDEIETHLHPRWKMRIMAALRTALPQVQFIATTHDPLCLRGMENGEVQVLVRDKNQIERLTALPDVKGLRAEQLLTSEFFGLGSTDPETDAKVVRYQDLALKDALTTSEQSEKNRLSEQIRKEIRVGDTMVEQIVVEALQRVEINPLQPLSKIKDRSREDMVQSLLDEIDQLKAAFTQTET